jgi:hypothetical protein
MKPYEAGHELDALVAEKVMGLNLTPPRSYALAVVGANETSVTGKDWKMRNGRTVYMPSGDTLPQPEGMEEKYNARYFAYAAEHGVDDLEAKVAACRFPTKPYSTDIAAAWEVVEKLGQDFYWEIWRHPEGNYSARVDRRTGDGGMGVRWFYQRGESAPYAICRAALAAMGVE